MQPDLTGPTGPRTEEGKARTRFNAVRHGLTGQNVVFAEGDAELYSQHCLRIQQHYLPVGPIQEALVRQIADCIWRLDRAISIEHGIFALFVDSQDVQTDLQLAAAPAQAWREESKQLTLLTLYVKRIDNKLAAHKAELKALQAETSEAPTAPSPEPPAQPAESVFSPIPNKPAPLPIKPEIHVPCPDLPRRRDAA